MSRHLNITLETQTCSVRLNKPPHATMDMLALSMINSETGSTLGGHRVNRATCHHGYWICRQRQGERSSKSLSKQNATLPHINRISQPTWVSKEDWHANLPSGFDFVANISAFVEVSHPLYRTWSIERPAIRTAKKTVSSILTTT